MAGSTIGVARAEPFGAVDLGGMTALAQIHSARVELELMRSVARYAGDPLAVRAGVVTGVAMAARAAGERALAARMLPSVTRVRGVTAHAGPLARLSGVIVRQLGVAALAGRGSAGASVVRAMAARAFGVGAHRARRQSRRIIVARLARHRTLAAEVVGVVTVDAALVSARKERCGRNLHRSRDLRGRGRVALLTIVESCRGGLVHALVTDAAGLGGLVRRPCPCRVRRLSELLRVTVRQVNRVMAARAV